MRFDAYLSQFASSNVLSNEETVSLYSLFKSGERQAFDMLVKSNMRLVVKIANDYKYGMMDFEDIVSSGTIGLLKAIEMFDPEKGGFSQYASAYINKYIRMALDSYRGIHTKRYDRMTREERSSLVVESLNEKVGDGDTEFADSLASDEVSPSEAVEKASSIDAVRDAIDNALDAREQYIVRARYGLDGNGVLTLREIAEKLGMTHERVRQIEVSALTKLRERLER